MAFADRLMFVTPPGTEPLIVVKEALEGMECSACGSSAIAQYPVASYQGPRIVTKCQDCFHILELRRPFPEEPWPPFRAAMYDAPVSPSERAMVPRESD
ncbi:MAG: hypothetical protein JWR85_1825 [Marmoricola sp.]|nr:hypothetical protein [Marmoricola sp.]